MCITPIVGVLVRPIVGLLVGDGLGDSTLMEQDGFHSCAGLLIVQWVAGILKFMGYEPHII